ncbi:MAG: peptidoglycan-associated lipoprotein Pal [bacterium]
MYAFILALLISMTTGCANGKWFWQKKKSTSDADYPPPDIILPPPADVSPLPPEGDTSELPPEGDSASLFDGNLREIRPVDVSEDNVVSELQTVYFPYDSYQLLPQAMEKLEQNAKWIKAHPDIRIQIEGHCDERGSSEYNVNLGSKRASRVREYLARLGVDPSRVTTISYGEERPVDPGHTEEAWAKNRRAQFLIY